MIVNERSDVRSWINIYDDLHKGFENDLKWIKESEPYYTTIPYILKNFVERCGVFNFAQRYELLEVEEANVLYDLQNEVSQKLNEKINERLKWHGARLDEHLGNVPAALIMVNCCNDLLKVFGNGMEFTDEKKITDN